jgi:exodeoxyribonuclease V alpha subunit
MSCPPVVLTGPLVRASRNRLPSPADLAALRTGDGHCRRICADPIHAGFRHKEDHMLECDLLVVDETSMIDVPLMHALLKAVPDHAALILVSEIDQLPPVGPGQVVADIIGAYAVPVVRLTEVFR